MPAGADTGHELLTADGGERRLLGSRCQACNTQVFPRQRACPRCGAEMVDVALPGAGTVWSVTVQRLAPKPPYVDLSSGFEPFAVAYVDLGPLLIETPLAGRPPEDWRIGDRVRLASDPDRPRPGWPYWFEAERP